MLKSFSALIKLPSVSNSLLLNAISFPALIFVVIFCKYLPVLFVALILPVKSRPADTPPELGPANKLFIAFIVFSFPSRLSSRLFPFAISLVKLISLPKFGISFSAFN